MNARERQTGQSQEEAGIRYKKSRAADCHRNQDQNHAKRRKPSRNLFVLLTARTSASGRIKWNLNNPHPSRQPARNSLPRVKATKLMATKNSNSTESWPCNRFSSTGANTRNNPSRACQETCVKA